jgi:hypothetical protein
MQSDGRTNLRRVRALGVLAGSVTACVLVLSAAAGDVRGSDPAGDVRAPGLTAAERAALDIRSVRVVGAEGLGAFVTVTFAGNIEQLLGTGHLRQAVAGIVLRPASTRSTPAGLLERGAELVPLSVRVSAKKVVQARTTTAETYRKTRSTSVGVVRHRNQLFFFIVGSGFSSVAAIDVRTFASLPEKRGAQAGLTDFMQKQPSDEDLVEVDPSELSTGDLQQLLATIDDELDDLNGVLPPVESAHERILLLLHDIGSTNPAAGHLKSARDALDHLNTETIEKIRLLNGLKTQIETELKSRTSHMPMLELDGGCGFFDPTEIACEGVARTVVKLRALADTSSSIDALQATTPDSRTITAFLCPTQLPTGTLSQTSNPNDTLTCSGGSLAVGQPFRFNLRTNPAPTAGMTVRVSARQDGAIKGPFTFNGP